MCLKWVQNNWCDIHLCSKSVRTGTRLMGIYGHAWISIYLSSGQWSWIWGVGMFVLVRLSNCRRYVLVYWDRYSMVSCFFYKVNIKIYKRRSIMTYVQSFRNWPFVLITFKNWTLIPNQFSRFTNKRLVHGLLHGFLGGLVPNRPVPCSVASRSPGHRSATNNAWIHNWCGFEWRMNWAWTL